MLTILAAILLCFDDLKDDVFEDNIPCHPEKICPECGIDHDQETMYSVMMQTPAAPAPPASCVPEDVAAPLPPEP